MARGWGSALASAALVAFAAHPAARADTPADDEKQACVRAYETAQTERRAGHLAASRAALTECLRPRCPPALTRDCVTWLDEVDAATPTVVLAARDARGAARTDVEVEDAGKRIAPRLDGAPVALDPGEHHLVFRGADGARAEVVVTLREGEKGRHVEATLASRTAPAPAAAEAEPGPRREAAPPAPAVERARPVPTEAWIFGGIAVAGFATFGVSGALGLAKRGDLEHAGCRPRCPAGDVQQVQGAFYAADVALEIGAVTGAIAVALYLLRPERPVRAAARLGAVSF
ncbi:MAG TPA: hypothetical protein VHB21_11975 [Minicystis sp.]|nr:hypothetical protein [Minicystis sp.]